MEYITPIPQEIEAQMIKQELKEDGFDAEMDIKSYENEKFSTYETTYVVSNTISKLKSKPLNRAGIPFSIKTECDLEYDKEKDIAQPMTNNPGELLNHEFKIKTEIADNIEDHFNETNIKNETFEADNRRKYGIENNDKRENIKPTFQCKFCKKIYFRKEMLIRHITKTHLCKKEQTYKCGYCEQTFSSRGILYDHIKSQCENFESINFKINNPKFKCTLCQYPFTKKRDLRLHVENIHMIQNSLSHTFDCDICKKSFFSEKGYRSHLNDHLTIWH